MLRRITCAVAIAAMLGSTIDTAKTSHEGWPQFDGSVLINRADANTTKHGTARSDELLGGHGNDQLYGEESADVIWGDHRPSGQPSKQFDHLYGGDGNDFIYASHGENTIDAGRGKIDCGSGKDILYVSRRAQKKYKITHCETISHKTLGY
jgi:Ca2+-binding RTX toxin-like protein